MELGRRHILNIMSIFAFGIDFDEVSLLKISFVTNIGDSIDRVVAAARVTDIRTASLDGVIPNKVVIMIDGVNVKIMSKEPVYFPEDSGKLFWRFNADTIDFGGVSGEKMVSAYGMFEESSVKHIKFTDVSTPKLKEMSLMFHHCYDTETIEMDSITTDNVTNMNLLFSRCQSLKALDLRNFRTNGHCDMSYIFEGSSPKYVLYRDSNIKKALDRYSGIKAIYDPEKCKFCCGKIEKGKCVCCGRNNFVPRNI